MKKLAVFFLCFFASNAFASSADSGKCPWKMPFTIIISGNGTTHGYGYSRKPAPGSYVEDDTNYLIPSSFGGMVITVDTCQCNSLEYSLIDDKLHFIQRYGGIYSNGFPEITSVLIIFAPGKDSIISITISDDDSAETTQGYFASYYNFKFSSLLFNDTSIFSSDSSFGAHNILMTYYTTDSVYINWDNFDYQYTYFSATSVSLSGIFSPTTFSNPPAIVTEAPQPNNLTIYSSNGSTACSFDVSDHERNLEVFSPLGIRESSVTILPNQTEASLLHLPPGIYFVRLEGAVTKILVGQ